MVILLFVTDLERLQHDTARIAIVGVGLLGGSLGLALRQRGYTGTLIGVGRRQASLDRALARNCVDQTTTDLAAAAKNADLIVLATPLGTFEHLLTTLGGAQRDRAVITDVGSTKCFVESLAARCLPNPDRFVGSHPMAGSETHGPDAADPELFVDKPCVITSADRADRDAVERVRAMWRVVGMRLIELTPGQHDRAVAAVSHLPHAVAALLVELAGERNAMDVASTGFRDTTRIASGDPGVWMDIFQTNRDAVVEQLACFEDRLRQFRERLTAGDDQAIEAILQQAKHRRDHWRAEREEPGPASEPEAS